ncbi:MAG: hypothetical protein C4555_05210 [Dehalococcoidia bacterium]|nr:MAG: hypothetical protein C4555_05210 [Dehalococcoidia bacterium]
MSDWEPRPPIYPAEWLEQGEPVQDGMLHHFLAQPTDWKTRRASETQPFDFRENLSVWARNLGLAQKKG